MKMAKLGVLFDRSAAEERWKYGLNTFEIYVSEILDHAGITYSWFEDPRLIAETNVDILIVALMKETAYNLAAIRSFAERGGWVVTFAGLNGMAGELNYIAAHASGPGYAQLPPVSEEDVALRFLYAVPGCLLQASREGFPREASNETRRIVLLLLRLYRLLQSEKERWNDGLWIFSIRLSVFSRAPLRSWRTGILPQTARRR
jgi:hypothetical protein